jgi:cation transport ATPase
MGTGTDVAAKSITLVKGDLQGIVKAKIESCGNENINQNLFFAFFIMYSESRLRQGFILFGLTFTDDCCIGNEL